MPEDVYPEIRQVRPYSEETTLNMPCRSWSQNSEGDRYRRTPHTALSDISDNVSPISTTAQLGLPPIPPFENFMPFRPLEDARYIGQTEESDYQIPVPERSPYRLTEQSGLEVPRTSTIQMHSEPELAREEAQAENVPRRDTATIIRKPVAVNLGARAAAPSVTPPERQSQQAARQSRKPPRLTISTRGSSQVQPPFQIRPSPQPRPLPPLPPEASTDRFGNHVEVNGGWRRPSQIITRELNGLSKVITSIFFLLIPIPFFALAIGLATMDGKPTNERRHWGVYQELMKVAGTFLPIIFALLIGRAVVKVSSYLLEHGTTLENLEQLMGSRTFGSSITTQIQLRSFNFLGILLIALFILSPIGSQGFLRLLSPSTASRTSPSTIPYFTTDTQSLLADADFTSSQSASSILRTLYNAATLAPSSTKASPRDLWTNLKIPYLSSLPGANGSNYISIKPNTTLVYTSLAGIPLGALQSGETSLTLESSYLELNCGSPVLQTGFVDLTTFPLNTSPLLNGTYYGTPAGVNISGSGTAAWSLGLNNFISPLFNDSTSLLSSSPKICIPPTANNAMLTQSFLSAPCALQFLSNDQVEPSTLLFQASILDSMDNSTIQAFCQTSAVYVQSKVLCEGEAPECRVIGLRESQLPHAPGSLTPLAFPLIFSKLSQRLPRTFETSLTSTSPDPSLLYLSNPDTASIISATSADLMSLSGPALSRRLGQLINTYYTLSQGYDIMTQGGPTADRMQGWPSTLASVTLRAEFYKISWGWFAFVFMATLVMFIASLIGAIVEYRTSNPEILGSVSSVIRNSMYVDVEGNESNLTGVEISRRNKRMRIKMGRLSEMEGAALVVGREEDVVGRRSGKMVSMV